MKPSTKTYEQLGLFYLGREYDLKSQSMRDDLLLYDSNDLLTHAMCVGMTGSGKTGLCVSLLEEAAVDGIPALIVDPKGDLANLLLAFPGLTAEEFRPWIDDDEARRAGMSADEFARERAKLWKDGLAKWDIDAARIANYQAAVDLTIYTPGSDAGMPLSVLSSFAAPDESLREDGDLLRDRVATTVSSLLGLLGLDADPLQSREHILLSTLIDAAWREGRDVDLGGLIQMLQAPPVSRVGVMDLESFFPAKDRFALAMTLNNLLASPGFNAWMTGDPLNVRELLRTKTGKPRLSILSIAHLSDAERMFFVSLLLNETLSWMRTCAGTSSLRALLYMDEIYGYMPPVAEPPSKKPLLTLLKQARAFGLGVVLATQNPVDLDYKGLSNIGTWFLGRLQTERDKARVLEGLEGAATEAGGGFDRGEMEATLAGLGKRVFLMHNVHEDAPVTFHSRWAMSYLRGPLARDQIKALMSDRKAAQAVEAMTTPAPRPSESPPRQARSAISAADASVATAASRPVLPPGIDEFFLPTVVPIKGECAYRPRIIGAAEVHFVERRRKLDVEREIALLAVVRGASGEVEWEEAAPVVDESEGTFDIHACLQNPEEGVQFDELPAAAAKEKKYAAWKKSFANHLYHTCRYELLKSALLNETSLPGEDERDFRVRLAERAREERDLAVEKLKKKYATKFASMKEKIRKAELTVAREEKEASGARWQSMISIGSTLLSAVLGRKAISTTNIGKASTAAKGWSRASKQAEDVDRAKENVKAYGEQLEALEKSFQEETENVRNRIDPLTENFETVALKPRRTDVDVQMVALAWAPYGRDDAGEWVPLWK